jgi:hypothetical protein
MSWSKVTRSALAQQETTAQGPLHPAQTSRTAHADNCHTHKHTRHTHTHHTYKHTRHTHITLTNTHVTLTNTHATHTNKARVCMSACVCACGHALREVNHAGPAEGWARPPPLHAPPAAPWPTRSRPAPPCGWRSCQGARAGAPRGRCPSPHSGAAQTPEPLRHHPPVKKARWTRAKQCDGGIRCPDQ